MNNLIKRLAGMGNHKAVIYPLAPCEIFSMKAGEVTYLVTNYIRVCADSLCMKSASPIKEWCEKALKSDFRKGYDEVLSSQAVELAIAFANALAKFSDDVQTRARNEMVRSVYNEDMSGESGDYVFLKTIDGAFGRAQVMKAMLAMLNFHHKEFVKQGDE